MVFELALLPRLAVAPHMAQKTTSCARGGDRASDAKKKQRIQEKMMASLSPIL